MSNHGVTSFSDFLTKFDKLTLVSLASILAVTFALDLAFSLQPPWPRSATYMTAFLELAALFVTFFWDIRSKTKLRRLQRYLFISMVVLFLLYFLGYSYFVFETPLTGERVIGGFVCSNDALKIAELLSEDCPFLSTEALAAIQFDTEKVWTPWSVKLTEFLIFVVWSSFFILSTLLFGITIAFMHRQEARSRN